MEDITIYTTVYPIEYVVNRIYGTHAVINSIYPNGIDVDNYEVTDTLITEYSSTNLFIFNGLSNEQSYVKPMLSKNKNLKIIDVTSSMDYDYAMEDLWLDPTNLLTIANNIKKGFNEYISSSYLKDEIDSNYEQLKIDLTNLDSKYRQAGNNASKPYLIVSNDAFKYLEKYGITVISLQENDNLSTKIINDAKSLISEGKISYIFLEKNEQASDTVNDVISGTNVEILYLNTLSNLTDEERITYDYMSMMTENLNTLKEQLYN
jgi:zinc transport system substrate-binding protein